MADFSFRTLIFIPHRSRENIRSRLKHKINYHFDLQFLQGTSVGLHSDSS